MHRDEILELFQVAADDREHGALEIERRLIRGLLDAALRGGARLWPVDSEHSAIAQCLRGNPAHELRRLWLTASGGPFRGRDADELIDVGEMSDYAPPGRTTGGVRTSREQHPLPAPLRRS